MVRWRRGNRGGCCVVVPIGCLTSVALTLLFSGLAFAQLMQGCPGETGERRSRPAQNGYIKPCSVSLTSKEWA
jgi:hypothetical protein